MKTRSLLSTCHRKFYLLLAFLLSSSLSFGQGELTKTTQAIQTRINDVYKLMSVLVFAAVVFYGARAVIKAIGSSNDGGEAWKSFGMIMVVAAIWFFGIPALISSLGSGVTLSGN